MPETDAALAVFTQLYDEPATLPRPARLPPLHAGVLQDVLGGTGTGKTVLATHRVEGD